MKFISQLHVCLMSLAGLLLFPNSLLAQTNPTSPSRPPEDPGANPTSPSRPPASGSEGDSGAGSQTLTNPLAFDSIQDLLVALLNVLIVIATPIVVFFIIFAGFKYVTAQGNAEKVKEATRALTYAVIGGVLIIGAVAIAEIIGNVVDQFSA